MNMLLSVATWFAQNWMLLVLVVVAIALLVPTYLRQKKEISFITVKSLQRRLVLFMTKYYNIQIKKNSRLDEFCCFL